MKVTLPPCLGDKTRERGEVEVPPPLPLGKDPFVVERGKKVAAIEGDCLLDALRIADEPVELLNVEPEAQIGSDADTVGRH